MKKVFTPEQKSPQDNILEDISYTKIPDHVRENTDISDYITTKVQNDLRNINIDRRSFERFFDNWLAKNINEAEIISFSLTQDTLNIFTMSGKNHSIAISDIQDFLSQEITAGENPKDVEWRIENILEAIKSIYHDNDGVIFDGEINDQDTLSSWEFAGKTLSELKELLDTEKHHLYAIYQVTNNTKKQQLLLAKEIDMFAGVWDFYEWGAQYFALGDQEIQQKVGLLIEDMSIHEIFSTIIRYNEKINSNWRKSDMVKQVNAKLMSAFYIQTLDRLQRKNASSQDVFHFVRIITGREQVLRQSGERNEIQTAQQRMSFDNEMANYDIASKALLYLMHRPGGVFEEIQKTKKNFEFGDPEIENKAPKKVIESAMIQLTLLQNNNPNFWKSVLKIAGFEGLIETKKTYQELSFDEKIQLWAIYRITQYIKALPPEHRKNPQVIKNYINKTSSEAFKALEEDLNQEFDGTSIDLWIANPNFFGSSADDLWLSWDFAEIFSLYQDIHGNSWFFDLHDANEDWFQSPSNITTLGVWIIAWIIILPALTTATVWTLALAWAKIWIATATAWLITSREWYDTYKEAITVESANFVLEVAQSAVFMALLWKIFLLLSKTKVWSWLIDKNWNILFNKDMLFSREAWSPWWIIDKIIIALEVMGWAALIWSIQGVRKNIFPESYFDTDTHHVKNNKVVSKI